MSLMTFRKKPAAEEFIAWAPSTTAMPRGLSWQWTSCVGCFLTRSQYSEGATMPEPRNDPNEEPVKEPTNMPEKKLPGDKSDQRGKEKKLQAPERPANQDPQSDPGHIQRS
jgi:hypothetical protein